MRYHIPLSETTLTLSQKPSARVMDPDEVDSLFVFAEPKLKTESRNAGGPDKILLERFIEVWPFAPLMITAVAIDSSNSSVPSNSSQIGPRLTYRDVWNMFRGIKASLETLQWRELDINMERQSDFAIGEGEKIGEGSIGFGNGVSGGPGVEFDSAQVK